MLPGGRGGEFIIVAAIALIVVGPKDLPKMLRQLGRFVGKMRAMADDFKASFEDMARQSELDELRKEVEAMRTQNAPGLFNDVKSEMQSLDSELRDHLSLNAPEILTPQPASEYHPTDEPVLMPHPVEPQPSGPEPKARKPRKAKVDKSGAETAETAADPVAPKPARRRKGTS